MYQIGLIGSEDDKKAFLFWNGLRKFGPALLIHGDHSAERHYGLTLNGGFWFSAANVVIDNLHQRIGRSRDTCRQSYDVCLARWKKWEAGGYPGVDREILPLLQMLAVSGTVVPMWSCIGHIEKPLGEDQFESGYLAVSGSLEDLRRFANAIYATGSARGGEFNDIAIELDQLVDYLTESGAIGFPILSYPVVTLRWYGNTEESLANSYKHAVMLIDDALKNMAKPVLGGFGISN